MIVMGVPDVVARNVERGGATTVFFVGQGMRTGVERVPSAR